MAQLAYASPGLAQPGDPDPDLGGYAGSCRRESIAAIANETPRKPDLQESIHDVDAGPGESETTLDVVKAAALEVSVYVPALPLAEGTARG